MNVRVTYPGGLARDFPVGTPVREAAADPSFPRSPCPLVAARLNNEVVSLESALTVNCSLEPVDLGSKEGVLIYRKSLCFLLSMASKTVFPKRRLVVGHSLGQSYYYYLDGVDEVSPEEAQRIESAMREIVSAGHARPVPDSLLPRRRWNTSRSTTSRTRSSCSRTETIRPSG